MLVAVGFLHDLVPGIRREGLGQQPGSFDAGGESAAPPLVRYLVCHHVEWEIEALRTVLRIQEGKSLLKCDHAGFGVHTHAVAGMLDETDVAVRVRTELFGVVVQRRSYASEHAVQVRGVPRVMEDPDRDNLP